MTLGYILLSTVLISLFSLAGVVTLIVKKDLFEKIIYLLVALAAGVLMGNAFLHLLPEAVEQFGSSSFLFAWVLIAFVFFFLLEKIFHWRHCHKGKCPVHSFGWANLVGDSFHNFIDGLIIAGGFIYSPALGLSTSVAIALHEIPQELSDFGVLIYAGFSKKQALLLNLLVALTAVAGGIVGFYLLHSVTLLTKVLLPFTAGGFLYISASDLVPEIRKHERFLPSLSAFGFFILGLILMGLTQWVSH